jgi:hypothetical protein
MTRDEERDLLARDDDKAVRLKREVYALWGFAAFAAIVIASLAVTEFLPHA